MKHIFFLCFFFWLLVINAVGQRYYDLVQQAKSFHKKKDYYKSTELYLRAFKLENKNCDDLFDGACATAMTGDLQKAFALLDLAVDKGYANINQFEENTDLNDLHNDKRWGELSNKIQQRSDKIKSGYDVPLQKELLEILSNDQDIRLQYDKAAEKSGYNNPTVDSLGKIMAFRDSVDIIKVMRILDESGWVGKDKVGVKASQVFFLVIQHSTDFKVQEKYLPMLRDAVKKGNASPRTLAYMEDRVALRQGKKQIYGTQIYWNEKTSKNYVAPLENPDNVDRKRATVGLDPLAEYVNQFDIIWDVEEYKKQLPELEKISKKW